MKAEEFINRKFKTIGLSNPNSYPISFVRDVVIRLMEEYAKKQLQKEAIIQLQQLEQIKEYKKEVADWKLHYDGLKQQLEKEREEKDDL